MKKYNEYTITATVCFTVCAESDSQATEQAYDKLKDDLPEATFTIDSTDQTYEEQEEG